MGDLDFRPLPEIEDISAEHATIIEQVLSDIDDYESIATDDLDAIFDAHKDEDMAYLLVQSGEANIIVSFDGDWGSVCVDGGWSISSTSIRDVASAAAALLEWCPEAPQRVLDTIVVEKSPTAPKVVDTPPSALKKSRKKGKVTKIVHFGNG